MKILTLNHYESDFLADGLIQGLHFIAQKHGWSVAELPIIKHVHGGVDEGYLLDDGSLGYTSASQDLINNAPPLPAMSEHEVLDRCSEFDLIVMTSHRSHARAALHQICQRLDKRPKDLPLVICDGDDHPIVNNRVLEYFSPKVFFKRELVRSEKRFSPFGKRTRVPVWPLPFAARWDNLPEAVKRQEKFLDVFCSMGATNPRRVSLVQRLLDLVVDKNYSHYLSLEPSDNLRDECGLLRGRLNWEEYMRFTIGARVSFSMTGWGKDTLHYWEGLMSGTEMIVEDPGIWIPYPFTAHEHYLPMPSDLDRLNDEIQVAFDSECGPQAKKHCLAHHTTEKRAEYMLQVACAYVNGSRIDPEEFALV